MGLKNFRIRIEDRKWSGYHFIVSFTFITLLLYFSIIDFSIRFGNAKPVFRMFYYDLIVYILIFIQFVLFFKIKTGMPEPNYFDFEESRREKDGPWQDYHN